MLLKTLVGQRVDSQATPVCSIPLQRISRLPLGNCSIWRPAPPRPNRSHSCLG